MASDVAGGLPLYPRVIVGDAGFEPGTLISALRRVFGSPTLMLSLRLRSMALWRALLFSGILDPSSPESSSYSGERTVLGTALISTLSRYTLIGTGIALALNGNYWKAKQNYI